MRRSTETGKAGLSDIRKEGKFTARAEDRDRSRVAARPKPMDELCREHDIADSCCASGVSSLRRGAESRQGRGAQRGRRAAPPESARLGRRGVGQKGRWSWERSRGGGGKILRGLGGRVRVER